MVQQINSPVLSALDQAKAEVAKETNKADVEKFKRLLKAQLAAQLVVRNLENEIKDLELTLELG